jgi:hypothetical protein
MENTEDMDISKTDSETESTQYTSIDEEFEKIILEVSTIQNLYDEITILMNELNKRVMEESDMIYVRKDNEVYEFGELLEECHKKAIEEIKDKKDCSFGDMILKMLDNLDITS